MKRRLSESFLKRVKATGKPVLYRDSTTRGFGAKVTANGAISFFVEGRQRQVDGGIGKNKRLTLGRYPHLPLEEARKRAMEALTMLRDGLDPREEAQLREQEKRRAKALSEALSVPLGEVVEDYLTSRPLKATTVYDHRITLNKCFSDWFERPIREINRKDVEQRYKSLLTSAGAGMANKGMRILSAVFNYAKAEEIEGSRLIESNPVEVIADKKIRRPLKPRTSHIPPERLPFFIQALREATEDGDKPWSNTLDKKTAALLRIYTTTGLRKNELLSLEWANVHLNGNPFIVIVDPKNGLDHYLPLTEANAELLRELEAEREDNCPWVFPASRGQGHMKDPRKKLNKFQQAVEIPFMIHDLRRTFASAAAAAGVEHSMIKRTLNHKSRDVTELYVQTGMNQIRPILEQVERIMLFRKQWESALEEEIAKNIIPFKS